MEKQKDKIKREGLYQDRDKGGIRMIDIETMSHVLSFASIVAARIHAVNTSSWMPLRVPLLCKGVIVYNAFFWLVSREK